MDALLIPIGSAGDVHPFVGLGLALKARGHRVTLVANGHFGPLAQRTGLDFAELGTEEEYREVLGNPDLWHPTKGPRFIFQRLMPAMMRRTFEAIRDRYIPGETLVVAPLTGIGARVAQEALGIPLVTIQLQPAVFRSVHQVPVLPGLPLTGWMPRSWKRWAYWLIDEWILDPMFAPEVNAFRAELDLPPVRRLMDGWCHSPQLILGMFPEWYAPPQPDWPPQTVLTGFPLFDERGLGPIPAEVSDFLAEGDPPIVFTPGSAMRHGRSFFEESLAACRRLGRRGMLLTRFREQVPADLPAGICHVDYIPFSQVLPHAAALVHHGGIGTSAQGLAAGIPHLVMPLTHDQPDNAARLKRLGVARALPPRAYRAPAVARALRSLLDAPEVATRCRTVADRFPDADPLGVSCLAIERLAERSLSACSKRGCGEGERPDAGGLAEMARALVEQIAQPHVP